MDQEITLAKLRLDAAYQDVSACLKASRDASRTIDAAHERLKMLRTMPPPINAVPGHIEMEREGAWRTIRRTMKAARANTAKLRQANDECVAARIALDALYSAPPVNSMAEAA